MLTDTVGHFKIAWYCLLSALVVLMIALSAMNGEAISTIEIRLIDGVEEHRDKRVPFLQEKDEALPDYSVSCMSEGRWHPVGTALNRSASEWIGFDISDPPNMRLVQSIRVSDEDPAENDNLDEVQVAQTYIQGDMFEYRLATTSSFKAGMHWFATTALGKAIFGAIAAAVFLVVLSHLARGLP